MQRAQREITTTSLEGRLLDCCGTKVGALGRPGRSPLAECESHHLDCLPAHRQTSSRRRDMKQLRSALAVVESAFQEVSHHALKEATTPKACRCKSCTVQQLCVFVSVCDLTWACVLLCSCQ